MSQSNLHKDTGSAASKSTNRPQQRAIISGCDLARFTEGDLFKLACLLWGVEHEGEDGIKAIATILEVTSQHLYNVGSGNTSLTPIQWVAIQSHLSHPIYTIYVNELTEAQ